jgi:uncharacterized pyridoxamine 5'-phosphate oxidase family protein
MTVHELQDVIYKAVKNNNTRIEIVSLVKKHLMFEIDSVVQNDEIRLKLKKIKIEPNGDIILQGMRSEIKLIEARQAE